MFKVPVKAAALVFAFVLCLNINMDVKAAGLTEVLPSGGINVTLDKGVALKNIQETIGEEAVQAASLVRAVDVNFVQEDQEIVNDEAKLIENLVVAEADEYVNIRSTPSEKGKIIGKFYDNAIGELLGEENGWYHIQSGNVTGYVKASFCVTGEEARMLAEEIGILLAVVNCDGLYVREEASVDSQALRLAALKDELLVLDEQQDWVKVDVAEGFGWVSREYVELKMEYLHAESKEEAKAGVSKERDARERARKAPIKKEASDLVIIGDNEKGVEVAEYAIQFVGNPYVWGGESLSEGADCSGFVLKVYEEFGVSLPHYSGSQRRQGSAVKGGLKNAQPGDLICYDGHVALYIGEGKIVHAASEKSGIKIGKANYRPILAIRRIFKSE